MLQCRFGRKFPDGEENRDGRPMPGPRGRCPWLAVGDPAVARLAIVPRAPYEDMPPGGRVRRFFLCMQDTG